MQQDQSVRGLEEGKIEVFWRGKSKTKGQLEVHVENNELEAALIAHIYEGTLNRFAYNREDEDVDGYLS